MHEMGSTHRQNVVRSIHIFQQQYDWTSRNDKQLPATSRCILFNAIQAVSILQLLKFKAEILQFLFWLPVGLEYKPIKFLIPNYFWQITLILIPNTHSLTNFTPKYQNTQKLNSQFSAELHNPVHSWSSVLGFVMVQNFMSSVILKPQYHLTSGKIK